MALDANSSILSATRKSKRNLLIIRRILYLNQIYSNPLNYELDLSRCTVNSVKIFNSSAKRLKVFEKITEEKVEDSNNSTMDLEIQNLII